MSTATYQAPTQRSIMAPTPNRQLPPELEEIVDEIFGLRALAASTGYMTFRSQREILAKLTPKDQAAIGHALYLRDPKLKK
jgi:hypothetical protein